MRFVVSLLKAALLFGGYYMTHVLCAWLLPFSSAGYTVCANVIAVALTAVMWRLCHRVHPWRRARLVGMRRSVWLASIGVGIGGCLLARLMMVTVPFPETWTQHYTERMEAVQQAPAAVLYLSTIVIAPLAEEWIFRGHLYRVLKSGMPRVAAALLSSVLFAVLHGSAVWIVYTSLLGLLLVWLYEQTHSLWACVACHTAFNVVGQVPLFGAVPDGVTVAILAVVGVVTALSCYCLADMPDTT